MKRPRIYERYRGNEFKKEPVTGYFVAAYSDYQASFLLDQLEWSTGDIGIIAKWDADLAEPGYTLWNDEFTRVCPYQAGKIFKQVYGPAANWHECTAEMKRRSQRKIYKWMLELE